LGELIFDKKIIEGLVYFLFLKFLAFFVGHQETHILALGSDDGDFPLGKRNLSENAPLF
jgi:hypothetical protein